MYILIMLIISYHGIIYIDTVIYVVLKQFLKTVPTYIKVTFEGEQNLENFEKLLIW